MISNESLWASQLSLLAELIPNLTPLTLTLTRTQTPYRTLT